MNTEENDVKHNSTSASDAENEGAVHDQRAEGPIATNTSDTHTASEALTELQEKYQVLNDKYLRLYSEFENYRKRTAREKLDIVRNAGAQIFKELLPVVDDFDRAVAANENDNDIASIKDGFKLIHSKLYHVIALNGVKPMDVIEKTFDPDYHEAITNIPAPSEDLKGKVLDVAEKGYFYHDHVLRYAKVIVAQ